MAVYEVFERMAFYGISSNLVIYLTKKLHQGTVKSANNVTNWVGTVWMTPFLGAYVADAHLGRYWTFVIASAIYLCVRNIYIYIYIPSNSFLLPFLIVFLFLRRVGITIWDQSWGRACLFKGSPMIPSLK